MYKDHKNEVLWRKTAEAFSKRNTTNPLPWEKLGRVNVIRAWADEIKATLNNSNQENWALVGHAITIVHDDTDECENILKRVAADIEFQFISLDYNEIKECFLAEDIEGLTQTPTFTPTLVYLKPDDWMKSNDDIESEQDTHQQLQKNICEIIKQFNPNLPVIFATSIAEYDEFSKDFRQVGLFDRRFNVIKPTLEELAILLIESIGDKHCGSSIKENLGKVGKLIDMDFDDKRRRELIALTLKRTAVKEKRLIEFHDLVNLAVQGSNEYDPFPEKTLDALKQVAIHEAGHALIAMIDSEYKNIPEYVSIVECDSYNGIVSDSYEYHLSKNRVLSYGYLRHQIRTTLAGRVAEHFALGSENVRIGSAKSDLRKATNMCFDMFTGRGFSDDMESHDGASNNLAIEPENPSQSYLATIESMVKAYLKKQYEIVYKLIEDHQEVFHAITNDLLEKKVMSRQDLIKYCSAH
jgi:hypothetical protein